VDILHYCPHNREAAGFCGEGVNLIRALPDIAKETFNGIRAADVAMHDWRKRIKGQEMLFIFDQAADGFWIAFLVCGFECCQIEQRILFLLLLEDPS